MLTEIAISALWVAGGCAAVATLILALVGARTRHRSHFAATVPVSPCAVVRAGRNPVQVTGHAAPGPSGPLHGRLSGTPCVWYGLCLERRFEREYYDIVQEETRTETVEQEIWAWDSGPFGLSDQSGRVLVASALLHKTMSVLGYPRQQVFDEYRELADPPGGALGTLLSDRLVPVHLINPAELVHPAEPTLGFRVTEQVVPAGVPISALGLVGLLDGAPILASPVPGMPALSQRPLAGVLARGGRRLRVTTILFALATLLCFGASAVILVTR